MGQGGLLLSLVELMLMMLLAKPRMRTYLVGTLDRMDALDVREVYAVVRYYGRLQRREDPTGMFAVGRRRVIEQVQ